MKTPTTLDEVAEPRFVFMGAKGAILAFAVTALMLAAIYLVVGGKEEAREPRQTGTNLQTMLSLSALDAVEAEKHPKSAPSTSRVGEPVPPSPEPQKNAAPTPPPSAPGGIASEAGIRPSNPAENTDPGIPAAPSPKQNKKPGTPAKEGRPWAINVASVQSKTNAQHVLDRLKKGGYNAYIDEAQQDGTLWHRVRVGFFPSREEARRTAQEISQSYGLQSPWLAEQPQE